MRIKFGYVLVLVLVAAGAAVPGVDGYLFRQNYTNLLAALGEKSPLKLKLVNYNFGWLSSDAQLSLDLNAPDGKQDPAMIVTIDQHIMHGPFVQDRVSGSWTVAQAAMHSHIHIDKKTETTLLGGGDTTAGIAQVNTIVTFDNQYQNKVQTPIFSTSFSQSGGKLTWQGVLGNVDVNFVDNKVQHVKSDLALGALEVQDPTGNLSIKDSKLTGERTCQGSDLCSGSSDFSIPTVDALVSNISAKLVGTDMKTTYGLSGSNAFSASATYAFTKLTLPDFTVGPLLLKFAVNDLDSGALSRLLETYRSTYSAQNTDPKAQGLVMLAALNTELPHIVTAKTVVTQDTSVDTSFGNFRSTAKFYWPANTPLPTNAQGLTAMNFNVDMHAATALVQKIVKTVDAQRGFTDSDTFATEVGPVTATAAPAAAPAAVVAAVVPAPSAAAPASAAPGATPAAPPAPPPAEVAAAALANATKAMLQPYVASHKVDAGLIDALIALQKQHLTKEIYNTSVDGLLLKQRHLPKDIAKKLSQELKDLYAAHASELEDVDGGGDSPANAAAGAGSASTPAAAPAPVTAPAPAPAPVTAPAPAPAPMKAPVAGSLTPPPQAPTPPQAATPTPPPAAVSDQATASSDQGAAASTDGPLKQELDALIKQGYITLDKDNYAVSIVYDGSVMKVNGIAIPVNPTAPNPAQ